jgi:hypothetical protein
MSLAVAAVVVSAALSGMLAACGSSDEKLDTQQVQRAIAASILAQHAVRANVQCPANVARKAGQAFTCFATLDVGSYPVAVTEKDDAGHVRYGSAAPLVPLDVAKVESSIADSILAQRHLTSRVRCPATVLQRTGLRFICTATVAGRSYPFEVTETDAAGHVRYVGR